jgi:Uma2 family endonuclease
MVLEPRTRIGMPLDEFIAEYDRAPFELIDGERKPIVPSLAMHLYVISQLVEALVAYRISHRIAGRIFTESTFVLLDVANWVRGSRVPDIGFYTAARWDNYLATTPDWGAKPLVLVPDLCVEVISKNDLFGDVQRKAALYLEDGVREVWVVSPDDQSILVYTAGSKTIGRLTAEDTLSSALLPDFALPVAALFPG